MIRNLKFQLSLRSRINDTGKLKDLELSSFYSSFILFLYHCEIYLMLMCLCEN